MKYQRFIFKDYDFDPFTKVASFHYSYDDILTFTETFTFNFEFADYDNALLDRAVQLLFFMAGVSYYKAFLAPRVVVEKGELDEAQAAFFGKTYQRGLGEFFYLNKLDANFPVVFPATVSEVQPLVSSAGRGLLVGIGGGKDSLVSVELLRGHADLATWSVGHQAQLEPLVAQIGVPHYWVERSWDRQLLELKSSGGLNGHVPISAILACAGAVTAVLSGRRDIVVSNENSANEATLDYQGVAINHQYSKSLEFEKDFQTILEHSIGEAVRYYSLLRPLSELAIAEIFAKNGFEKYKTTFSSCNRAFTHDSHAMFWCGECPKCAFVFLALTPFVERAQLEALWNGKNLLLDSALEPLYRQLLGIKGDKPLECVGEIKESRAAMRLAQQLYPELHKYSFELHETYDFRALAKHAIPTEIANLLPFVEQNE